MTKFNKYDDMKSKRSKYRDDFFEIIEFMGETLELPINKFKNMKNGLLSMTIVAFIISVFLDYYSSFDISRYISGNEKVGTIYFAIRSLFIFVLAIIKFKIIYRVANIFFFSDKWKIDEKYSVLFLVMLQSAFSMAFYPFGVYIVILEAFIMLLFFLAMNYNFLLLKKVNYVIVSFVSLYIGLRFVRLLLYNIIVNYVEKSGMINL
ncbi:hypothetical protein [uncultured Finegoldia sp.]|uniref:hypothetical protein n=1 Tax=uncultured Finegoldia sp. TaxID=328009 RepID=UPI00262828C7|nr:hypothetical protein [uncultured Finegoldia sp.]